MRNRSQKTAETLLLEPTKQGTAQRKTWKPASHQAKLKKKVFGTRMRKSRTPAGFVPKLPKRRFWNPPKTKKKQRNSALAMRNRSQKNAETLLLETTQNKEKKLP